MILSVQTLVLLLVSPSGFLPQLFLHGLDFASLANVVIACAHATLVAEAAAPHGDALFASPFAASVTRVAVLYGEPGQKMPRWACCLLIRPALSLLPGSSLLNARCP